MSVLTVILAVINGHTSYYQTSAAIVSKLYSITFLASLNSRMQLTSVVNVGQSTKQEQTSGTVIIFEPQNSGINRSEMTAA